MMSLQNIDMVSALRRLADCRIEDAMKEGKFDNLAGAGKPLNLEPLPADEGARMMWWMLRIMKNHDFTPHEVVWRKTIDRLKDELDRAIDESRIVKLVDQINRLARQINTLGTNALHAAVPEMSIEKELEKLRRRVCGTGGSPVTS